MKNIFILFLFASVFSGFSQEEETPRYSLDVSYFQGSILKHNPDISHLITKHPSGFILGFNRKTAGKKEWQRVYNYPDYGGTFVYHNPHNTTLGSLYALYAHYNFYFFNRKLQFRVGQGLAYSVNPYHKENNFRNVAYGSRFMAAILVMGSYEKPNLLGPIGIKAGFSLMHFSNGNSKAPNTSTNSLVFNGGITYDLQPKTTVSYIPRGEIVPFKEPVKLNLSLRWGVNQSDVVGAGQYAFYVVSAYADKRLSKVSAIQFGTEVFFTNFLKEQIQYRSIAFPNSGVSGDEDYKRVGLFVGHELFINRLSVIGQLGYYVYYPFDFEGRLYNRLGLKYYVGKKMFVELSLKSHAAKAESVGIGIGMRL